MSSRIIHTGVGQVSNTNGLGYSFSFATLERSDIQVEVIDPSNNSTTKTVTTHYTIENYSAAGSSNAHIKFVSETARGFTNSQTTYKVKISRQTPSTPKVNFTAGSSITASDLNTQGKQAFHLSEENRDSIVSLAAGDASGAIQISGSNIADNSITTSKILDLEVGTSDLADDAVTTAKITNLNITTAKIADDAVTTDKLANSINTSITAASFTTGMIMMFTGSSAPSGWAFCDGNNGTPDLRDKFIVGAGTSYSSGDTGGLDTVTLTTSNLPSHTHAIHFDSTDHTMTGSITNIAQSFSVSGSASGVFSKFSSSGQHTPTTNDAGGCDGVNFNGTHRHLISGNTNSTGSGTGFDNKPPYYALSYIMKL